MQTRTFALISLIQAIFVLIGSHALAKQDAATFVQQAQEASQKGDLPQAIVLAGKAIKAAPKQAQGWLLRAQLYDLQKDHKRAIGDYTSALKLEPKAAEVWQRRGEANFRSGKISESLTDFDAFLRLVPDQKPYHWQRGISLYYAGRFAEGKAQFELHQTVNSQDVENAVWHFLCTARAEGLEKAKQSLIPIVGDARIPMAQVLELFAGKATPTDVLTAAKNAPAKTRAGEPLFYANLYLGLYYEALKDTEKAKAYILKAAERAKENGYMGDVAWVHAEILKKQKPKKSVNP